MKKNMNKWKKPNLIIIGQGKPEENVLAGCKYHDSTYAVFPTASRSNCNEITGNCRACSNNGKGQS